jgi:disulfide bond formation protein DsbB
VREVQLALSTHAWIDFFTVLTVLANAAILALVGLFVASRLSSSAAGVYDAVRDSLGEHGLALAALVAGTATAGSLYLSEGAHLVPCELCWFQRICMYPLALLLVIAAARRDWAIRPYALALAGIGLVISSYHYLIERFPELERGTSCDPQAPCTVTLVWKLHYVTIPFMAGSAFLLVLLVLLLARDAPSTRAARDHGGNATSEAQRSL